MINKQNIYIFCLSTFLISIPFEVKYNNIGLIILVCGWLINFNKKDFFELITIRNFRIIYGLTFLFYVFFFIRGITIVNSNLYINPEAIKEYGRKSALLIFPLLFNYRLIASKYKTLLKSFIFGIVLAIVICVINALIVNFTEGINVGRGLNHFNAWYFSNHLLVNPIGFHPTLFALVSSLALHLCLFQILNLEKSRYTIFQNKATAITFALILFSFMLLLSSRNVLFSTIFSLSFLTIRDSILNRKVKYLVFIVSSLFLLTAVELSINHVNRQRVKDMISLSYSTDVKSFGGTSFRLNCTKALYNELVKENFLTGIGSGSHKKEYNRAYLKYKLDIAAEGNYNAHNQYLEILIQNGILGLILLLGIYSYLIWICLRSRFILGIVIIYLLAIVSITESILEVQKGIWLFATLIFVFVLGNKKIIELR